VSGKRKRPRRVAPGQRRMDARLAGVAALQEAARILPGLPGGALYVSRTDLERFADEQLKEEVAAIRAFTPGAVARQIDARRYGGRVA
jgi:tRNA G46 methylase TrmB